MSGTEQRGVCAVGKKPTARSINRILKLFESFKIRTTGRKYFFDTLIPFLRKGIMMSCICICYYAEDCNGGEKPKSVKR